jgi:hypothetical protein
MNQIKLRPNNIISFILERLNSKLVEVKLLGLVKCEVLTKACVEITLFLDVTPCISYRSLLTFRKESCCAHPQRGIYKSSSTLKMKVVKKNNKISVVLVCERTIPTERPPFVGEVSANFCG